MADGYRTVNGPKGPINFPSSMSDADIEKAMGKLYPAPETSPEAMEKKATARASEESKAALANVPFIPGGNTHESLTSRRLIQKLGQPEAARQMTPVLNGLRDFGIAGSLAIPGAGAESVAGMIPAIARTAIGGTIGAGLGGEVGGRAGSAFGPTGREVGGAIGAVGGGLLGGGLAGGLERNPATPLESERGLPGRIKSLPFGVQRFIPDWAVPKGEEGSPTNPGWYSKIPARIPRGRIPSAGTETGGLPEDVMHVPEPNPLAPGEKPGSMYSVPREELAAAAQRSKPGAIDVLRDLGRPMIVIPKEAGYPGPRIPAIEEEETPQLLRRAAD